MKKTIIPLIIFAALSGCDQQPPKSAGTYKKVTEATSEQKSGILVANMDQSIRPQDDFYRWVNGHWLDNTQVPEDKLLYSTFLQLEDIAQSNIKTIIEQSAQLTTAEPGSDAQKVGDLYRSYMNTKQLKERSNSALLAAFSKIDNIKTTEQVAEYFAYTQIINSKAPFRFTVNNDQKNPTEYIVYLIQSGLGLPNREYYFKNQAASEKIRAQYLTHITQMLELAELKDPKQQANRIFHLESAIASMHWTQLENNNRNKTYNKYKIEELSQLMPSFAWDAYLGTLKINHEKNIIISQPSFFKQFDQLFQKTTIEDWKSYFKWTYINSVADYLSKDFVDSHFNFYRKAVGGVPKQQLRWRKAVDFTNSVLGEIVGKIYVEKYFKPAAKAKMQTMVENLQAAFRASIEKLDWMGKQTKQQALDKLSKFNPKIGYPDKWKDYSSLEIKPNDLIGNYLRAAEFNFNDRINLLGKPINKNRWYMTPQTVNAYYNPVMNEIVFPAAILQPPFFNLNADDAINYGAIGGIIGHEIIHGFDDQGSMSDGDGMLRNWWQKKDLEEFKLRSSKLSSQFSEFEALPGEFVNGDLTLSENIGDLGGLSIAYQAYQLSLNNNPAPIINNLNGSERFFIGWAQSWAYQYREKSLRFRLNNGPHSPAKYRVNGVLMNMPEFIEAFNVQPTDKMYRKPEDRVKIW